MKIPKINLERAHMGIPVYGHVRNEMALMKDNMDIVDDMTLGGDGRQRHVNIYTPWKFFFSFNFKIVDTI